MTPPSRLDICECKLGAEQPIIAKIATFWVLLRGRRGRDPALRIILYETTIYLFLHTGEIILPKYIDFK